MRKSPWPHTYRTDPGMAAGTVITAINEMRWNQEEWQALRVAANLDDERSESPESYGQVAFRLNKKTSNALLVGQSKSDLPP